MTIERTAQGCLLGLACGDALGRPVEFKSAEEIASQHGEVTEMLGRGTHGQPPGTVTDDTEMALCIAESLVDRRGFDPADVAERFVDWLDDLRDKAQTMVGELYVMYESLRRVAVRHPEIEYEQWQASTALSGGR